MKSDLAMRNNLAVFSGLLALYGYIFLLSDLKVTTSLLLVSVSSAFVITLGLHLGHTLTHEKDRTPAVLPVVRALDAYAAWARSKWGITEARTLSQQELSLLAGAVGLTAEAGELLDLMKKHVFHRHPLTEELRQKCIKELGDVRFYYEMCCIDLGVSDAEVQQANREKLDARYTKGFTPEESITRKDVS